MKKNLILLLSCLAILLLVFAAGCSRGNISDNAVSEPLRNPTIKAGGKTLYLPCTFGELLDFGFEFVRFGTSGLTEENTPENTTLENSSGISGEVRWNDGSIFSFEITPLHWRSKTASKDCIVTGFSDTELEGYPPKPEEYKKPNGVSICGVDRRETMESIDEKFKMYTDIKTGSDIHREFAAQDGSKLEINGYNVGKVAINCGKKTAEDDSFVIRRSLDFDSVQEKVK